MQSDPEITIKQAKQALRSLGLTKRRTDYILKSGWFSFDERLEIKYKRYLQNEE